MHMLAEKQVKKRLGPLLSGLQGEQQKAMSGPEKKAQKLRVSTTLTENWVRTQNAYGWLKTSCN